MLVWAFAAMDACAQHSARPVRLSIQPTHFSSNVTSLLLLLKPVSRWGPGTCPHLDFTSSGLLQNLIPFQLFHLEGSANGDLFDGLSFLKRKKPDLQEQSTVAYVWRDYITPCTMNAMGIWCVLWLVAFALTSAAPKSHQRLLENTNEQKDTLQVERDNQENILSQVRISSPAQDTIISVQLLY